jgi:hypothetical protein
VGSVPIEFGGRALPLTLPLRGSLPLPANGERVGVRGLRPTIY